jgi:hypothetical protein
VLDNPLGIILAGYLNSKLPLIMLHTLLMKKD